MTVFGWITVALWSLGAINPKTEPFTVKLACIFMVFGTLLWGTGHL